ncbi:dynamin family protein [Romboutsia lituseburensis]|uniref:dynamin family protein n=1 Tax=Romboutsia lituseburensis TaxID=1537 RepID=UPI00215A6DAC|nr:dynamin family protein [Romboutsia lituseburensis]MCR8744740.1 dynamin family protein [Romboutsia lituseburensis]
MYESRQIELSRMISIIKNIEQSLDMLKLDIDLSRESKTSNLFNLLEAEVKKTLESVLELKNPFLLFVIGSGNYGKSTLINALLNQNIVETNDIPNTWKLDEFIMSDDENIEIYYTDKEKEIISVDKGKYILKNEEYKFKKSKKNIANMVKEYKKNKDISTKELKEYKVKLEHKYLYKSNIEQVKYYLKKGDILNDFIIVDTPGLNQTLLKNTLNRMKSYYERADGVIWLIDASNIVSNETSKLINEINDIDRLYKTKKNKIAVVNKIDIIEKENLANLAKVRRRISEIYKNKFEDIVYISAKYALDGFLTNNYELVKKSNINELYNSIYDNFTKVCEHNQIASKYRNLDTMRINVMNLIYSYKRELYNDMSIYNQIDFDINKKLNKLYISTNDYLDSIKNNNICIDKFNSVLKDNIEKLQNQCNIELKKLYEDTQMKANLSKKHKQNKVDTEIYFTKSKNIIINYHTKSSSIYTDYKTVHQNKNILDKFISKKTYETQTNEILFKEQIYKNINSLKNEINEVLNDKIEAIKFDINQTKNNEFEKKYIHYSNIKKHIEYLNDIENILNDLR